MLEAVSSGSIEPPFQTQSRNIPPRRETSTTRVDQNPDHQTDALSRPQLDLVLKLLRDGDQLAITRLDRLGRSVLHLNKAAAEHPTPASPETPPSSAGTDELEHSAPPRQTPRACPGCGHEPTTRGEAAHQRADLAVTWLYRDPDVPGEIVARNHCRSVQPGDPAVDIACSVCGDGPILAGELADSADSNDGLSQPVQRWLTDAG